MSIHPSIGSQREFLQRNESFEEEETSIDLEGSYLRSFEGLNIQEQIKNLNVRDCLLTESLDLAQYKEIEVLNFGKNGLSQAPNTTTLLKLQKLFLDENWIYEPPDLSKNVFLRFLSLSGNKLSVSPDVSKNVILKELYLSDCELTHCPNIYPLNRLEVLDVSNNKIQEAPVFRVKKVDGKFQTPPFREIHLENNQLKKLSSRYYFLPKSCEVYLKGNCFSEEEKERILLLNSQQQNKDPDLGPKLFFEEIL